MKYIAYICNVSQNGETMNPYSHTHVTKQMGWFYCRFVDAPVQVVDNISTYQNALISMTSKLSDTSGHLVALGTDKGAEAPTVLTYPDLT